MKEIKRKLKFYSYYDRAGIEAELTQMAAKGWLIENISGAIWTYRRIEPMKLTFCVTYYPEVSRFNSSTEKQRTLYDLSAHLGWMHVTYIRRLHMHILYNVKENPAPIETDPEIEVKNIHRSTMKRYMPWFFAGAALWTCFITTLILLSFIDPISIYSDNSSLYGGLTCIFFIFGCITEIVRYFSWYSKAKAAAFRGEFLKTHLTWSAHAFSIIAGATYLCFYLISSLVNTSYTADLILFAVIPLIAFGLYVYMDIAQNLKGSAIAAGARRRVIRHWAVSAAVLISVIITVSTVFTISAGKTARTFDISDPPLTLDDLISIEPDEYRNYTSVDRSLLMGYFYVSQEYPNYYSLSDSEPEFFPETIYRVIAVRSPFLYNLSKKQLLNDENHRYLEQDPAKWGAQEAYLSIHYSSFEEVTYYTYLLFYNDHIVTIRFNWVLTSEQIAIIAEKLGNM